MANVITLKVDARKLDKARFFEGKPDKDGHRPLYVDLVLMPKKEVGQFGDTHFIVQSKKKDENIQMPIIGNATERGGKPAPAREYDSNPPGRPGREGTAPQRGLDEYIPF